MRRNDAADISAAAQEYLLALRVMGSEGRVATSAQLGRHVGVTTQAASEMCRRLAADGLLEPATGRGLALTTGRPRRGRRDLPPPRAARVAPHLRRRAVLGGERRRGDAAPGSALAAGRDSKLDELLGHPEVCPHGNPIDLETARRRPSGTPLSELESGTKATVLRITEEAEEDPGLLSYLEARALTPGAHVTVLARSESLDSLTLEGPRGRATLGLRPAALIRVLPGEADPALFHRVPAPLAG